MICNQNTKNGEKSKLLAVIAVLAVVICAFAIAIPSSEGADAPQYTMGDAEDADHQVITYQPEEGDAQKLTLAGAMAILQNESTSGGTMTFPAGEYDVYDTVNGQTGSAFVVKASGITIQAADGAEVLIYTSNYVTYGTELTANDKTIQGQSAITISGKDVTIDGLTVMNNIYQCNNTTNCPFGAHDSTAYESYKSIWISGATNATVSGCTIKANDRVKDVILDTPTAGGAILADGTSSAKIVDTILVNASVNTAWSSNVDVEIGGNTTFQILDDQCSGLVYESDGSSSVPTVASGSNVVIDIQGSSVNAERVLNRAVEGTTVEINAPITINDNVDSAADVVINSNVRNNAVFDAASLQVDGKFTNTAKGTVNVDITGAGSVTNDGTMNAVVEVPNYTNNNAEEVFVYGNSMKQFWYPNDQIVTVPEGQTWTIVADGVIIIPYILNVEGNLILEEGATLVVGSVNGTGDENGNGTADIAGDLTIDQGAKLVISRGTVNVNGTANVDGSIYIGYDVSAGSVTNNSQNAVLNINSDTVFSDSSTIMQTATTGDIVVASGVTLTLEGIIGTAIDINNSGSVVIDSEPTDAENDPLTCDYAINIYMMADGASVEIQNLAMTADGKVVIDDAYLVADREGKTIAEYQANNRMKFDSNGKTAVISGLTVVENFDGVKENEDGSFDVLNTMDLFGSIAASEVNKDDENISARIYLNNGDFTISDAGDAAALSIGENCSLEIMGNATLTVSGYVPVNADAAGVQNNGTVTLAGNGHIYLAGTDLTNNNTVNAAFYETTENAVTYYNYVTVDTAIADANANSAIDEIVLYGENTVTVSATVPAIDFTFEDAILYIGSTDNRDVTLTIAAGADYNGTAGTVEGVDAGKASIVFGTLYFNDRSDLRMGEDSIDADVISKQVDADGKDVKNGWAKYTNIYTAMAEANSGDVITVFEDATVELDRDFTVKEGVTLVIPDGTAQITINDGVTLTVAGTLQSDRTSNGIVAEHKYGKTASADDETSAIVVTGTLKVMETVEYQTPAPDKTLASGSYISGAYFTDGEYKFVTPLSIAVSDAVLPTVVGDITVNGTVTEGDTVFTATDDCNTIVIGNGAELTLSSITLANEAILKAAEGDGWFTGTISAGDASIAAVKVADLNVTSADGLTVEDVTVSNYDKDDQTHKNNLASLNATAGTVIVNNVDGDLTVDAGATVTVDATSTSVPTTTGSVTGKLYVDGTVALGSGQILNVTGNVYVDGTVNVAAADGTDAAGALNINSGNGAMYVGLDDKYNTTSETAAVNGDVNCTTIYAAAGTTVTVDADVFTKSTQYVVEGNPWISVYTKGTVAIANDAMNDAVPVENAYFNGTWVAEDDSEITTTEGKNKNVGDENCAVVTAKVKYDIYVINLRADQNAVSSVYIDGNIMQYGMIWDDTVSGGFYYGYTAVVSAGSHKIDYQLANGYSGNGVLTVNGTQMSGMTFTTEGNPTTGSTVPYELQLSGFEKSGYVPDSPDTPTDSGDDGMSITDILLIVLVVLIIIMAIIVAVRLMRS